MKLHHWIHHHAQEHKKKIIAHVQKHHRKYIFGLWVACWSCALKIIIISAVFLGINLTTWRSQASNEALRMHQSLDVFSELDNMVLQRFNDISSKHNPSTVEIDKMFVELDWAYNQAKNLNEKYIAAKKFVEFLKKWHDVVPKLWYTTSGEDKEFYKFINDFGQIK
jgi:hypothetical protein